LAKIIEAWPMLPGNAKEAIVAIVQSAKALGPQA
jgi:hypothetical protein